MYGIVIIMREYFESIFQFILLKVDGIRRSHFHEGQKSRKR